jgi:putative ABC transport system permease protein
MRRLSIGGILRRSLLHRRARSLSALVALTVSGAVVTALLTLYADLDAKLHHEFRGFGANIVVTAASGFDAASDAKAQQAAGADANVAAFAYTVASTDRGTDVVVAGVDFPAVRRLDSWWQVDRWPDGANDALLGQRAAEFVGDEKAVTLTFAGKAMTSAGAGRLKTGGDEDSRIYLPMQVFTEWTSVKPTVLEVQVPGGEAKVDAAIARLAAAFPAAQVAPVRQLVEGESSIVDKTRALMFGAVLLIALTVAISVLATLSASVLERRRDFALMKALGGSDAQMIGLFAVETLVLASGGIVLGYIVGSAAAWAISEANFGTSALPRAQVIPLVILLNLAIAVVAALIPVQRLMRFEPAALLKGE